MTAIALSSMSPAMAQTYLTDVLKPTEKHKAYLSSTKAKSTWDEDQLLMISNIYKSNGGFRLVGGQHGLIGENDHGYITYNLKGQYATLSFWLAPRLTASEQGNPKNKSILTVWADGVRIYDKPVFASDPPRFVTLDVEGVNELKFKCAVGELDIAVTKVQLWKSGVAVVKPKIAPAYPAGKVKLVEQMVPYYTTSYVHPITTKKDEFSMNATEPSINMARHTFNNGLQFTAEQQLLGERQDYSYFWLNKQYDKISFIVGPRDNQSSNTSAWLVIYGDNNKILYEGVVKQTDLPRQEVVSVAGQDRVCFSCELRTTTFLGTITFGAVEIYAHPKGDMSVPKVGLANINKEKVQQLKSPCSLMTNILPYSVRGVAKASNTLFTGESSYITFSMGGEKFSEGIILTSGTTLFDDNIDAYATFDLAEEFDYVSFAAGTLTQHRVLDDDRLRVYADNQLILDTLIRCTAPNTYFTLPLNKCRSLRFAKPGTGKSKQSYIGIGDIALYRGEPTKHRLFYHELPDFPDEVDLIDLCERPYFHYVGRYLSTITNFDFNDCFKRGGSQRDFFQMKDGSKIYKGVMLEANVPLPMEDITLTDAITYMLVGAGSAIGGSDVSAYTGVTAGGGLTGDMMAMRLMNANTHGQASVAAFNPYGEYEQLTFSIANKAEYWDDVDMVTNLGKRKDHHFKLYVMADQRFVKVIEVYNTMEPKTFTIPIYKCRQLMFWLEPEEVRSGQFVLYDMTLSKEPYTGPAMEPFHADRQTAASTQTADKGQKKANKAPKKELTEEEKAAKRERARKVGSAFLDALNSILDTK